MNTEILIILALIFANGFFALSELALVSVRRSRLEEMHERGGKGAKRALDLIEKPDQFLAAVQVGITLVGTLASVYGGYTIVAYFRAVFTEAPIEFVASHADFFAICVVTGAIAFFSIVLGELAPKYLALTHPERLASFVSRPITWITQVFRYIIPIFTGSAKFIVRIFGVREIKQGGVVSEMDVRLLLAEGRESGVFNEDEEELVRSALDFADTTARDAMTPRADMIAFDSAMPMERIIERVMDEGYSRYPIFEGSIDNVIGVIFLKDIALRMQKRKQISLNDIIQKPMFVPDSMELSDLLRRMQNKRQHLAICLDDFGGTAGLITLEDILEEIVGEIQDETDDESAEYSEQNDKVAFISGTLRPDQLNERFGAHLPEDQSATVAGLVVSKLGRIPDKQERIKLNGVTVTVLERTGSRITRMRIEKTALINPDE